MTLPAPRFPSAVAAVARFALLRHLRSRRSIIALVALALVSIAVGAARHVSDMAASTAWNTSLETALFAFASYVVPFLFHTSSFSEEHADRTLTFLLVRPISRSAIVLGKYLAGLVPVVVLNGAATILLHVICWAGDLDGTSASALGRALLAVTLLGVGHSAIAAMWSAIMPEHATPMTVVHFAVGELGLRNLPSILPLFSMHHHAAEIAGIARERLAADSPTLPLAGSAAAILAWTVAYLAAAAFVASGREYRFARA